MSEEIMGYRNKVFVIFDDDEDMLAYRFIRVWKANSQWTLILAIFTTSIHCPAEFLTPHFYNSPGL
jgi:hypothetical protein